MVSTLLLLLLFLTPIQQRNAGLAVTPCVRVENPHIKKGTLSLSPQTICVNISSSPILTVGRSWLNTLPSKWLQGRFNGYIIAGLRKPLSSNVPNIIVANESETTIVILLFLSIYSLHLRVPCFLGPYHTLPCILIRKNEEIFMKFAESYLEKGLSDLFKIQLKSGLLLVEANYTVNLGPFG